MEPIDAIRSKTPTISTRFATTPKCISAMLARLPLPLPCLQRISTIRESRNRRRSRFRPSGRTSTISTALAGTASKAATQHLETSEGGDEDRRASNGVSQLRITCHALFLRPYVPPKVRWIRGSRLRLRLSAPPEVSPSFSRFVPQLVDESSTTESASSAAHQVGFARAHRTSHRSPSVVAADACVATPDKLQKIVPARPPMIRQASPARAIRRLQASPIPQGISTVAGPILQIDIVQRHDADDRPRRRRAHVPPLLASRGFRTRSPR